MTLVAIDLSSYGYGLTAASHFAFAAFAFLAARRRKVIDQVSLNLFLGALVVTGTWALAALADRYSKNTAPAFAAAALDLLRYALWFAFLLHVLQPSSGGPLRQRIGKMGPMAWVAVLAMVFTGLTLLQRLWLGEHRADHAPLSAAASLGLAVLGVLLCEQLFRNLGEDSRWNAKPVCLGLGFVFAFDIYLHSEALLLGRFDADALAIRGAVHTLALPLLLVAVSRRGDWIRSLQISRSAAFYSASLVLVGGYMLFMAAIGYYVRYFGGDWGRALQLGVLFTAALGLLVLMVSGSLRARLRVFVGKNFFSYRYDYRQEWLSFTAMLSSQPGQQDVGLLVVRGLANMVECPAGDLWTRIDSQGAFRQSARWNALEVAELVPPDGEFAEFLRDKGWVVDLDEFRDSPRVYGRLALPLWLLGNAHGWLVVPLLVGDELIGFVTLARPRTALDLNWEVRDLLKTASRQAAGFLAQMQATEALLEARKFDAFNRMSAFVVHDLKNIVTQLSLMLKNAERLHANPEFQQDMLLTVGNSLEKMRRLMLQLREGATPPGGARGVELVPIIRRIEQATSARGRQLEVEILETLSTRGHDERLERVLGHLVHNALDATPADGRVWLRLHRVSGQVRVAIGDTGQGMSEDFIRTRLFRPFNTTKHSGMGIGMFESAQYLRELGGSIDVVSRPGEGTVMDVTLPLFEPGRGSDLASRGAA